MEVYSEKKEPGLAEILKNIGGSAKDIVKNEGLLLKTELFSTLEKISGDLRNTLVFGSLLVLGAIPLTFFLIISLGQWLQGNYVLSSLIVTLAWSALCSSAAFYYYRKLTQHSLELSKTKQKAQETAQTINAKVEEVKDAVDADTPEN